MDHFLTGKVLNSRENVKNAQKKPIPKSNMDWSDSCRWKAPRNEGGVRLNNSCVRFARVSISCRLWKIQLMHHWKSNDTRNGTEQSMMNADTVKLRWKRAVQKLLTSCLPSRKAHTYFYAKIKKLYKHIQANGCVFPKELQSSKSSVKVNAKSYPKFTFVWKLIR